MEKEKKEIWIEKLIELLNERMKEEEKIWPKHSRFLNYDGINHVFRLNNGCSFCMEFVLSKRYWFIKWLVENDKINLEEVEKINQTWNVYIRFWWDYEKVLMLLSISDTSIEDLLLYLK